MFGQGREGSPWADQRGWWEQESTDLKGDGGSGREEDTELEMDTEERRGGGVRVCGKGMRGGTLWMGRSIT